MKAVQFTGSIPHYLLSKALGSIYRPAFWSGVSCVRYGEVPTPRLPGPRWVLVKTSLGGICGSDTGAILLRESTAMQPLSSFPCVFGHEILGHIAEVGPEVTDFAVGDRVVVDPSLHCLIRGFADPCPACRRGDTNLCERLTEGCLAAGMLTGYCRDTGGSWGEYLVAHRLQLLRVPGNVSDESAILADPLATAIHAVMRNWPDESASVLVVGMGVVGICLVASLRALGWKGRIVALARHRFQGDVAMTRGANQVIFADRSLGHYEQAAKAFGAKMLRPTIGKPILIGGANSIFECVGSEGSIDDSLRFCQSGGRLVLVGTTGVAKGIDWTPIWLNQIAVQGSYSYSTEVYRGERTTTFGVAMSLMGEGKLDLSGLVTHRFPLADYDKALEAVMGKGRSKVVKAVFEHAQE